MSIKLEAEVPHSHSLHGSYPSILVGKQITNPPTKSIEIVVWNTRALAIRSLQSVVCETGITLDVLIDALRENTPQLLDCWATSMHQESFGLHRGRWAACIGHRKLECWKVEPTPTFHLLFDTQASFTRVVDYSSSFGFFPSWKEEVIGDRVNHLMYPFHDPC